MKILLTAPPTQPYVRSFIKCLEIFSEVAADKSIFFKKQGEYEVVIINWPDELTNWSMATPEIINQVKISLEFWKKKSKIVVGVHNIHPHKAIPGVSDLYKLVYGEADGLIHLGSRSIRLFKDHYGDSSNQYHFIIPHAQITYPNTVSKNEARKYFSLKNNSFLMTTFGQIRDKSELKITLDAYKALNQKQKHLLISNQYYSSSKIDRLALKTRFYLQPRIRVNYNYIADNLVQFYFKASDLIFLPRVNNVNTGIISVAAFFGKVIVGPNCHNIGETLRNMGNPTYNPNDLESLQNALDAGVNLVNQSFGQMNLEYLRKHCSTSIISGALHKNLNFILHGASLR